MAWVAGNFYLSRSDMENNALLFATLMNLRGFTKESISGMLGNIEAESGINPGIWENLDPYVGGYGLVQWTPYTKYSSWAGSGWENNGNKQCDRIAYERDNNLQWISTSEYPISFKEFAQSTDSPRELADIFLKNYERPADPDQPQRGENAENWYEYLGGFSLVPIWLLTKRKKRGRLI